MVQCRPAAACARKSPLKKYTLKKQDKTRQEAEGKSEQVTKRDLYIKQSQPTSSTQTYSLTLECSVCLSMMCCCFHTTSAKLPVGRDAIFSVADGKLVTKSLQCTEMH